MLGGGGDQDESVLGPALEDPLSDGRTDTLMGRVCQRWGSPGVFFGFAGSGRGFQRRGDVGPGSWRNRKCQAKVKSTWEGVSVPAKKGRHAGVLLCVGVQEEGLSGPGCGGGTVRLEADEEG